MKYGLIVPIFCLASVLALFVYHGIVQPRTQALTYGKDPGWGWSRDKNRLAMGGGQNIKLHASTKKRYTSITRSGSE
jgi:hypothetical protein